jgi:hypothetical protein
MARDSEIRSKFSISTKRISESPHLRRSPTRETRLRWFPGPTPEQCRDHARAKIRNQRDFAARTANDMIERASAMPMIERDNRDVFKSKPPPDQGPAAANPVVNFFCRGKYAPLRS